MSSGAGALSQHLFHSQNLQPLLGLFAAELETVPPIERDALDVVRFDRKPQGGRSRIGSDRGVEQPAADTPVLPARQDIEPEQHHDRRVRGVREGVSDELPLMRGHQE